MNSVASTFPAASLGVSERIRNDIVLKNRSFTEALCREASICLKGRKGSSITAYSLREENYKQK
jgi:hypothetical protein